MNRPSPHPMRSQGSGRPPPRQGSGRLVAFWKPYGVLSQFRDEDGHPGLRGFGLPKDVYAAGRLDHDSEGLLLLTDDGRLQHRLTHPRYGHPRTYWAQVEREPDDNALNLLRRGVEVKGELTKPATVDLLTTEPELPQRDPPIRHRKNVPTVWLSLTLTEGRNRQVRRMTAAVGHPTLRLVRSAIGPVTLEGLAPGQWRWITGGVPSGR